MALIVEDGTGLPNAESYVSVADCDTYHSNRGNTSWASLSTAAKEQNLRKATDYMVEVYRERWKGTRVNANQSLDWPRNYVLREDYVYQTENGAAIIGGYFYYPSDEVLREIKDACCILALKANAGDLNPDLSQNVVREKVDVLEVEYDRYSPQYVRYRSIDGLLSPFLLGSNANKKVMRT